MCVRDEEEGGITIGGVVRGTPSVFCFCCAPYSDKKLHSSHFCLFQLIYHMGENILLENSQKQCHIHCWKWVKNLLLTFYVIILISSVSTRLVFKRRIGRIIFVFCDSHRHNGYAAHTQV